MTIVHDANETRRMRKAAAAVLRLRGQGITPKKSIDKLSWWECFHLIEEIDEAYAKQEKKPKFQQKRRTTR